MSNRKFEVSYTIVTDEDGWTEHQPGRSIRAHSASGYLVIAPKDATVTEVPVPQTPDGLYLGKWSNCIYRCRAGQWSTLINGQPGSRYRDEIVWEDCGNVPWQTSLLPLGGILEGR